MLTLVQPSKERCFTSNVNCHEHSCVCPSPQGLTLPDVVLVRKSYEDKRRRRRQRGQQVGGSGMG